MRDTPLRPPSPPWIDKLKFIVSWWWMGCEPEDKWLYIQFSKAPAGRIALILITPDLVDIVKDWWKPKGLRNQRHGRKGLKKGRDLSRFWDVDQAVGSVLPDAEELRYTRIGSGQRTLFKLWDISDRVAWNIAVVEMATDLTFQTLYGIISTNNDQCPWFGRMSRSLAFGTYANTGMGVSALACGGLRFQVGALSSTQFYANVGEGWWTAAINGNFTSGAPEGRQMQLCLTDGIATSDVLAQSGEATVRKGDWTQLSAECTVRGPGTIGFSYRSSGFVDGAGVEALVFGGRYIR